MRRIQRSDRQDSPPGRTGRRPAWRRLAVAALAPLLALTATTATAQGIWVSVPNLPTARAGLASAAADCPEGLRGTCVYAAGGMQAPEKFEAYSPSSGTWATLPALKTPRSLAAATTAPCPNEVEGDCVYVLGGGDADLLSFATAEAYSTETGTWLTLRSMSGPRYAAAAATAPCTEGRGLRGTCVYVFGGLNGTSDGVTELATVEEYDPASNTWATLPVMQTTRSGHAGAAAPCPGQSNPRHLCVYAISGISPNTPAVEAYDPVLGSWQSVADNPSGRIGAAAATAPCPEGISNGCIYVVGGTTTPTTLEAYTPVTNTWVTLPSLPTGRTTLGAAAAPCPKNAKHHCVYAVGGSAIAGPPPGALGTAEAFAIERAHAKHRPDPKPGHGPVTLPAPDPAPAR
ncbi:Kelch repeat-containing protein [Streptomyces sp. NPDC001513]|uniref:Kelch repeat-containing protein n=1 Tax=Streptomyces sp. NPDC001513 TaxID=3364580 RepID=UPI00368F3A63